MCPKSIERNRQYGFTGAAWSRHTQAGNVSDLTVSKPITATASIGLTIFSDSPVAAEFTVCKSRAESAGSFSTICPTASTVQCGDSIFRTTSK